MSVGLCQYIFLIPFLLVSLFLLLFSHYVSSVCLSVGLSECLCLSACLCLSVCLSLSLSLSLSLCLSLSLSLLPLSLFFSSLYFYVPIRLCILPEVIHQLFSCPNNPTLYTFPLFCNFIRPSLLISAPCTLKLLGRSAGRIFLLFLFPPILAGMKNNTFLFFPPSISVLL